MSFLLGLKAIINLPKKVSLAGIKRPNNHKKVSLAGVKRPNNHTVIYTCL